MEKQLIVYLNNCKTLNSDFLDELKEDEKTYVLVAHNGIVRYVESWFHDMTNEEFAAFKVGNCEIRRYDF